LGLPPSFVVVAPRRIALVKVGLTTVPASLSAGTAEAIPVFVPTLTLELLGFQAVRPAPARHPVAAPKHQAAPSAPPALRPRPIPLPAIHGAPIVAAVPRREPRSAPKKRVAAASTPAPAQNTYGFDISWPQCGGAYPAPPKGPAVVGVNDGNAFSLNPCLASEARWAGHGIQLYLNLNSPPGLDATDVTGRLGHCPPDALPCLAYNFGWNTAAYSLAQASAQNVRSSKWWIDVETQGSCDAAFPTNEAGWSCSPILNSLTVQGAIDFLHSHHLTAGVYTTALQWQTLTGGYVPGGGPLRTWIAGVDGASGRSACQSGTVAGVRPQLLQVWPPAAGYDVDLSC
jgi:hypothetical protein